MTVAELIEVLKQFPSDAPVYLWDGDLAQYERADIVSNPAGADHPLLPEGAVVIWPPYPT